MAAEKSSPVNPDGRPINDTKLNRFLVLAAIKIYQSRLVRPFRRESGSVLFLTKSLCVKYGPVRQLPEASTMEFIARNTSIPVPKVYCAFNRENYTYLVMERIKGHFVGRNWRRRSEESKAKIVQQLKAMVDEMRAIPAPSLAVANVDGGRLWECRLPRAEGQLGYYGPFGNIDGFHQHLREGSPIRLEGLPEPILELIRLHDRDWGAPIFTHGNLSSLNIMADGDKVTGIVDWETAGWFPYYWEYTTACQIHIINEPFWRQEINKFIQPWPEELRMEQELRQRYFGDIPWP